jgi:hypothetical protein
MGKGGRGKWGNGEEKKKDNALLYSYPFTPSPLYLFSYILYF